MNPKLPNEILLFILDLVQDPYTHWNMFHALYYNTPMEYLYMNYRHHLIGKMSTHMAEIENQDLEDSTYTPRSFYFGYFKIQQPFLCEFDQPSTVGTDITSGLELLRSNILGMIEDLTHSLNCVNAMLRRSVLLEEAPMFVKWMFCMRLTRAIAIFERVSANFYDDDPDQLSWYGTVKGAGWLEEYIRNKGSRFNPEDLDIYERMSFGEINSFLSYLRISSKAAMVAHDLKWL